MFFPIRLAFYWPQVVIILILLWPIIFLPICYALFFGLYSSFYFQKEGKNQIPTLSDSGSILPSSIIFTYGLHLEALLFAIFSTLLYCLFELQITNRQQQQQRRLERRLMEEEKQAAEVIELQATKQNEEEKITIEQEEQFHEVNLIHDNEETPQKTRRRLSETAVPSIKEHQNQELKWKNLLFAMEFCTCFGCVYCSAANEQQQNRLSQTNQPSQPFQLESETRQQQQKISQLHQWNLIILTFGLLACFCMSVVGSVSVALSSGVHTLFALFMYLFGIIHVFLCYYFVFTPLYSKSLSIWYFLGFQLCIFLILPINILAIIVAGVVYFLNADSITFDIFPVLEYTTTLGLILYPFVFYTEFRRLALAITEKQSDDSS
jgi:hypothetical protein